jgi:hypothetical protein
MREKWTERKFQFDVPAGRMHCLMERLRGTAARIDEKVRGVPTELLVRREGETWSPQENIGHLADIEALHLGRLDELAAGAATLRAADMTNRGTWEANHNATTIERLAARFREVRGRLVSRLDAWDPQRLEVSALHPRLQIPMRVVDLAYFTAEHDDYHLARVEELLVRFRERP